MNGYLLAAIGLLTTLLALLGWRFDVQHKQLESLRVQLATEHSNEKIVTKYVDKVVTVVQRVPMARGHLEQLCRDFVMPSAGHPDAAPAPHTDDRPDLGDLAVDVAACKANSLQLGALQDALRPQLK